MSSLSQANREKKIRVGLLHSQSGTMALSETPPIDATLMALDEINQAGGILGRAIEALIADGASKASCFEQQARKLIEERGISTLFGCWTSASRKAVKPILEEHNALLWYPVQYEGLESSPNIFYSGSCPNQQVEPAVHWLLRQNRRRFYLIGSDYVFPRTANKLVRAQLKQLGGTILAEEYLPLGATDFSRIIQEIAGLKPDIVFNTLNGDSNQAFYRQYRRAGIAPEDIPILATSIAEVEVQQLGEAARGHYASWSYFQSLDTPENRRFVANFKKRYGRDSEGTREAARTTSDPIEAAYVQVYLWKQAVEAAQSFAVEAVKQAAIGQEFVGPGGKVKIEANHHLHKPCRIGRVQEDGQFEIVYQSSEAIAPLPWLGIENLGLENAPVVMELLGEVSEGIQQKWLLEGQSRQLEHLNTQLQREITERQQAELTLAESQRTLSNLLGNLPGMVYRRLPMAPWTMLFVSQGCLALTGYSTAAFIEEGMVTYDSLIHPKDRDRVRETLAAALIAQRSFELTYRIIAVTGAVKWVREQGQGMFNPQGELLYLEGIISDITDRKLAEKALQQSEQRWQLVVRATGDGIFDWNVLTGEAFASARLLGMVGYSEGDLTYSYDTWCSLVHPEDLEPTVATLETHLAGQTPQYVAEYRLRCKDGSYKWILARGQAQWDEAGNPIRMVGTHQDISDRKTAEEERQLLLTLAQAISAAPDFDIALTTTLEQVCEITGWIYGEVWFPTLDEAALDCSPRWYCRDCELHGRIDYFRKYTEMLTFRRGEGLPGQVWSSQHSLWVEDLQEIDDILLRLEIAVECGLTAAFGVPIPKTEALELTASAPLKRGSSSVFAVMVFFTAESRVEDRRSQELVGAIAAQLGTVLQQKKIQAEMNALFAAMTDMVAVRDVSGRCLKAIPTNTTHWPILSQAQIGKTLHQTLPNEQADRVRQGILDAVSQQKTVEIEYNLPVDSGEICLSETISPLSEEMVILVARDISDRKAAEEALRQKNEELSETLRQLKATQDELIQSEKMAALGQLIAGIAHEINTPLGAIRSSALHIADFLDKNLLQLPDFFQQLSAERQATFFALLQQSAQQSNFLSTREQRKLKRQLRRQLEAEKIAHADAIADTLVDLNAHESLNAFLPLLKDPQSDRIIATAYQLGSLRKSTQIVKMATERAAKVVFALKAYARYDRSGKKIQADLIEGMETVLTLYQNQIKQGVQVIRDYGDRVFISCYPDELNQVWINLIHNAIQAMENRGRLRIAIACEAQQVKVSITDSGKGIPPDIMPEIFKPFFTTKPTGEGSGLGLDIVRKIVDKHQGSILVESQPGRTTFTVVLPR